MNNNVYKELTNLTIEDKAFDLIQSGDETFYISHYNKVQPKIIVELTRRGLVSKRQLSKLLPKLENGKFELLPDDSFTVDDFPGLTNERTGQRLKFYEPKNIKDRNNYYAIQRYFTTYKVKMTPEEVAEETNRQASYAAVMNSNIIDVIAANVNAKIHALYSAIQNHQA